MKQTFVILAMLLIAGCNSSKKENQLFKLIPSEVSDIAFINKIEELKFLYNS